MARFRSDDAHASARAAVEAAIARVDPDRVRSVANALTTDRLTPQNLDLVADIGFVVPTESLAAVLGVGEAERSSLRSDVLAIVDVIGRQQPSTADSDRAAGRLMTRFANEEGGPVATISMLYQNHDATAALLASVVLAAADGVPRRPALARTVRVARIDTRVGERDLAAGDIAVLSLDAPANEFGAGPHACPGRALAEAIVRRDVRCVRASPYELDLASVERHADGRASVLPVRRSG